MNLHEITAQAVALMRGAHTLPNAAILWANNANISKIFNKYCQKLANRNFALQRKMHIDALYECVCVCVCGYLPSPATHSTDLYPKTMQTIGK